MYKEKNILGEFVIIVEGATPEEKTEATKEDLEGEFEELIANGSTKSEAAKILATKYNMHKRDIYDMFK